LHQLVLLILSFQDAELQIQSFRSCFIPPSSNIKCNPNDRYRTISGVCNNLENPTWGTPGTGLRRLLPPLYEDGRNEPRGGHFERTLPNPRWISQRNHPDRDLPDTRYTHMVMQFGQFLDHDISLTPKNEEVDCCAGQQNDPVCFVIPIPERDSFYSWVNLTATCLNFVRSTPMCGQSVRQQYNLITAYIDASNVYGSDRETAAVLRTYRNGLLQENRVTKQLPTREQVNIRPNTRKIRSEHQTDFVAGDDRANEHPFLTSLHIVFVREHNRVAALLRKYLPKELQTDEILYQETRRIIVGEMQNIVYGEYLPTILGAKYVKKFRLLVEETSNYKRDTDPSIINSFNTAAFRFGHSMINSMFMLISQLKKNRKEKTWFWKLREIFDGQSIDGGGLPLANMIKGLIKQKPQTCDIYFSSEVTNHLFQRNEKRENFGLDLFAMNMQRGRDHGLPGYNAFRKKCGLSPLTSFEQKPPELSRDYWRELSEVYEKVDDIDLVIGGIAEHNVRGGAVGPTFACIISEQFHRLKYGDRFFYTHSGPLDQSRGLSPAVKSSVLQRTLGDVICDNVEVGETQMWVTLQPNEDYNPMEKCREKRKLDMREIGGEISEELARKSRNVQGARGRTSGARSRARNRGADDGRNPRGEIRRRSRSAGDV